MPILEVKDIKKDFGDIKVLKNISFTMEKGQVVSIIGSSGSGKTTLLRCLNFLETPDAGVIKVAGKTLFDSSADEKLSEEEIRKRRLHFGLVFQSFNLFPQYTALQNVCLAPSLILKEYPGVTEEKITKKGRELLDQMGLSERINN